MCLLILLCPTSPMQVHAPARPRGDDFDVCPPVWLHANCEPFVVQQMKHRGWPQDDIDAWFRNWRDDEPNSEKEYELMPPTPDMIMGCWKGGTIPVGQPRNHVSTSSCDQPRCFSRWTTNGSHNACSQTGGQTGALPASSGDPGIMYLHRYCWAQKYQQAHVPRIQTSVWRRESDEACRSECRNYYDMPLVWHTQILMQLKYRHNIPKQRPLGVGFAARRDPTAAMIAPLFLDGVVNSTAFSRHGGYEQKVMGWLILRH